MLQHGQIDSSITQEQRKKEIGLMIKNSRKQENNGSCMYNLRQESVSEIKVRQKRTLLINLVYNLMKTESLGVMGDSRTL